MRGRQCFLAPAWARRQRCAQHRRPARELPSSAAWRAMDGGRWERSIQRSRAAGQAGPCEVRQSAEMLQIFGIWRFANRRICAAAVDSALRNSGSVASHAAAISVRVTRSAPRPARPSNSSGKAKQRPIAALAHVGHDAQTPRAAPRQARRRRVLPERQSCSGLRSASPGCPDQFHLSSSGYKHNLVQRILDNAGGAARL